MARIGALANTVLIDYGQAPERFGLIKADIRLANPILELDGPVVVGFDDCGLGWFFFDFAASVCFI